MSIKVSIDASGGDFKKALDGLGKKFETLNLGVKPYPSCRYSHAAIDGIIELKNQVKIIFCTVMIVFISLMI